MQALRLRLFPNPVHFSYALPRLLLCPVRQCLENCAKILVVLRTGSVRFHHNASSETQRHGWDVWFVSQKMDATQTVESCPRIRTKKSRATKNVGTTNVLCSLRSSASTTFKQIVTHTARGDNLQANCHSYINVLRDGRRCNIKCWRWSYITESRRQVNRGSC